MKFRTDLDSPSSNVKITYDSSICMFGSCFSDSIGGKLLQNKLKVLKNTFGTLYHPSAIRKNLLDAAAPTEGDVVQIDNRFVHYDLHSDIFALSASDLLKRIKKQRAATHMFLTQCDFVFITLGTAFHFYHKTLNRIVANCHKQPGHLFERKLSSVKEVIEDLQALVNYIEKVNADANIVLTVSPIRHLRDGLVENNRSKSHLLTAVHEICDTHEKTQYFPSYELIIDDLRDYRFYKSDMIHPSRQAIEYVYNKLKQTYMDQKTLNIICSVEKIMKSIDHRPIDPKSTQHQAFLKQLKSSMASLSKSYNIDFDDELASVNHQII